MDLTLASVCAMDLRYWLVSSVLTAFRLRGVDLVLGAVRVGDGIMLLVLEFLAPADRGSEALVGVPPRRRKTAGVAKDEIGRFAGDVGVRGVFAGRVVFELERGGGGAGSC